MISGIDLNKTIDYTIKDDKDNPTVWKIGVLPSDLLGRILVQAQSDRITYAYNLVKCGLKGWENFSVPYRTEKEKLFTDEIEVVPMELLRQINLNTIYDLSEKILEINLLKDDEKKN